MLVHDATILDVILPMRWVQGWKLRRVFELLLCPTERNISSRPVRFVLIAAKRKRRTDVVGLCFSKHVPSALSTLANPTENPHIRAPSPSFLVAA